MLRIAICDDSENDRKKMMKMIQHFGNEHRLTIAVEHFGDGAELVNSYEENGPNFDLIFLDVLMNHMDGIYAAHKIRAVDPRVPIVILSISREFALDSYDVLAFDYLLKPFEEERVFLCLARTLQLMEQPRIALKIQGEMSGVFYFYHKDIMFFEGRNHMTFMHLEDGSELRCAETLTELTLALQEDRRFFRCHKGYLVNMDYIEQVTDVFLLKNGTRVPFRIREKKQISDYYYQYFMERQMVV
jgi:DNA-binding LytR/AlgR family response regulator